MRNQITVSVRRLAHVIVIGAATQFFACGAGLDTPATLAACDASLTFDHDIAPIVAATGTGRCVSCHAKYDGISGITTDRSDIYKEVDRGSMPQGESGFHTTDDGKKFLAWLSCKNLK